MAALLARLGRERAICRRRDGDYFTWRMAKPLAAYRFLFWRGAELEGFLILQTARYADFLGPVEVHIAVVVRADLSRG